MPKYVVSKRMREATWQNTTVISGDVVEAVAELKRQDGGDIYLHGSADLLNSLIAHDLIDEYRLMVFPLMLGSGKRLFRETTDITHLELVETRAFESGVTVLTYRPAEREPEERVRGGLRVDRGADAVPGRPHRMRIACSRRSCSPTSSVRRRRPRSWAIKDGAGCSIGMTRLRDPRSNVHGAAT